MHSRYGKNSCDECDMRVGIESGEGTTLIYTHTHRYLCALMDFWCQFAELHDLINKSRQDPVRNNWWMDILTVSLNSKVEQGGRARVLLDIKLPCMVDIVVPRSYQDEKALVLSAKGKIYTRNYILIFLLTHIIDFYWNYWIIWFHLRSKSS